MTLLPKPVNCACPPAFALQVLDTLPGDVQFSGCLRCGRADLVVPIVTEDRPHDVVLHGYMPVDLSDEARRWAATWPRFAVVEARRVYMPAAARFLTEEQLRDALATLAKAQRGVPLSELLNAFGGPEGPPPASLPHELEGFVEMWRGLELDDATPLDELLDAATRFNGPNELAAEVLARRTDLDALAALLTGAEDEVRRKWGRYLVRHFHLTSNEAMAAIRRRLASLEDNSAGEVTEICGVLYSLGVAAAAARVEVEVAARRLERTDYYAHKDLTRLLDLWGR